jgi:hypothetical protein
MDSRLAAAPHFRAPVSQLLILTPPYPVHNAQISVEMTGKQKTAEYMVCVSL